MRASAVAVVLGRRSLHRMEYLQQFYTRIFGGADEQDGAMGPPRKVVAFGNVLLDQTVQLEDTKLLERYQLSLNTRAELDVETLSQVTAEACQRQSQRAFHLGGSALNTVRILKLCGTEPLFFGAVGADKYGDEVRDMFKSAGLEARLQTVDDTPTGRCICLVYKDTLALYANIGASAKFSTDYLQKVAREQNYSFLRPIERKQIIYIEGFFVPHREDLVTFIVRNYVAGRRRLAVNLSATYIVKMNYHHMLYLANNATFIFGNADEFEMFRECWGADSIEDLAKGLVQDGAVAKIIVITKGADGVLLITNFVDEQSPPGELTFQAFHAPRVDNVVDTTGCGDAFVAAFLHAWLEKRSLSECIRIATDVAAKVATQIGCHLP